MSRVSIQLCLNGLTCLFMLKNNIGEYYHVSTNVEDPKYYQILTDLLRSGETPLGVLNPALEASVRETHGPVGVGPEEGHKNDQRDGTPHP